MGKLRMAYLYHQSVILAHYDSWQVLSHIEMVTDDNQDYLYISENRKDFGEEYYLDKDDLENFDERFLIGGLNALKKVKPITYTQNLEKRNAVALESMAKDLSSIKGFISFSFWLSVLSLFLSLALL